MSQHIYPGAQIHITTGFRCWCRPTIYRICPECDGEGSLVDDENEDDGSEAWKDAGEAVTVTRCWRCASSMRVGLLAISLTEALAVNGTEELLVVHHKCTANDVLPPVVDDDVPAQDYDEDESALDSPADSPADAGDDDGLASANA